MIGVNKSYEQIIEKNLEDNVCGSLPANVQENCKEVVEQEIPSIWNSIINEYLDPVNTCVSAHLCSATSSLTAPDPVTCHLCKKTAQFIDKGIFEDPIVQKKVATKVKKICDQIPSTGNATAQCQRLVDDNIPEIMSELGKAVASQMCVDLQMCSAAAAAAAAVAAPNCKECRAIVEKLKVGLDLLFENLINTELCDKLVGYNIIK
mmetsp:Transcript_27448/g.72462  ORF Transcript_27448/g.72462 Transcript_27448/m.72462 type:complete len:206 (-) Transcript_27448:754-1371(-)